MRRRTITKGTTGLLLSAIVTATFAQATLSTGLCGSLDNHFGPFDYRTATQYDKQLVEGAHFTTSVETLREGKTGPLGGDIAYTLHVFPNHTRALYAMTLLGDRLKTTKVPGAKYHVECYYDRAIRFRPDDASVRTLYALFLIKRSRNNEARIHLTIAEQNIEEDPQTTYNIGLAYFELGDHNRSLEFAKRAYSSGITVPGLRNKLQRAGKWNLPNRPD